MDNTLVGLVILIGEKNRPIGRQSFCVDGKTVILCCNETPPSGGVSARQIVSTVTISEACVCVCVCVCVFMPLPHTNINSR